MKRAFGMYLARCAATAMLIALPAAAGAPAELAPFVPETDLTRGWYARIDTTFGTIVARLLPEQAPQSVAHFAGLAQGTLAWNDPVTGETQKGPYYDGIPVYLAKAGQRFEVGDHRGTGRGAPLLYVPADEGHGPKNFHQAGRLGLTRSAGGKVSGVQFFATAGAMPWLTRDHPCFGEIVSGRDVVLRISQVKTYPNGKPIEPVLIEKVLIVPVGDPPALAQPEPYRPRPVSPGFRQGSLPADPK